MYDHEPLASVVATTRGPDPSGRRRPRETERISLFGLKPVPVNVVVTPSVTCVNDGLTAAGGVCGAGCRRRRRRRHELPTEHRRDVNRAARGLEGARVALPGTRPFPGLELVLRRRDAVSVTSRPCSQGRRTPSDSRSVRGVLDVPTAPRLHVDVHRRRARPGVARLVALRRDARLVGSLARRPRRRARRGLLPATRF